MEKKSSELFDNIPDDSFDLLKDYAQPYSISIIGELLGVPEKDNNLFLDCPQRIVKMYDFEVSEEDANCAEEAAKDFYDYSLDYLIRGEKLPRMI